MERPRETAASESDANARSVVQVNILGTVTVRVDGHAGGVHAQKVRSMLATLALDVGRAVSHDDLADELWSGQSLGNTRNALQSHAARIRRILDTPAHQQAGMTMLRTVRNGYLLDLSEHQVDGNRFLDLANQGAAVLHADPARAAVLLREGLHLWRGPALLDAGDGIRCRSAAALFGERRLNALEDLMDARVAVGEARQALPELRQLVAQHPLRERLCELLMLALYRAGRQSEALELFHQTRHRLDDELGLRPGLALQRRYREILAHDPALAG
jgi:SARP family transcriptional regulator, regulator of embCAB operon